MALNSRHSRYPDLPFSAPVVLVCAALIAFAESGLLAQTTPAGVPGSREARTLVASTSPQVETLQLPKSPAMSKGLPEVDPSVASFLSSPRRPGAPVRIAGMLLETGRTVNLDLEAFEVWEPDAKIVEFTATGQRLLPKPTELYFRGSIAGEPGSLVFVSVGKAILGLVFSRDDVFAIAPEREESTVLSDPSRSRIRKIDTAQDAPIDRPPFSCGTENLAAPPREVLRAPNANPGGPLYTTTVYTASIAIETDYELYQKLGSSAALTTYVGNLMAASSAIYQRDIQVRKTVGVLHIYSTASDPWTQTDTAAALDELGDYWHANYAAISRSTVHLLSGKNGGGGIAWMGVVCRADFFQSGHWGGGYGVSSSLSGQFSTTSPGLYWDILCFSHEVGHNFGSDHTHCYVPPVDTCCSCATGSCTGSVPPEKGTIMSYCHLRPGGYNNIKLYLAVPTESSVAVYNVMRTYVESHTSCLTIYYTAPTVTSISPNTGSTSGGTSVTISGTNFRTGAVAFVSNGSGSVAMTSPVVVNSTTMTAVLPAHAAGVVNIVVQNTDDMQTGTLNSGFTYLVLPLTGPLAFYTLSPCRVYDTRNASGPDAGYPFLNAGQIRTVAVTGKCGIPAGAKSLSANLTVSGPGAAGYLTVYPADLVNPTQTSSINFQKYQTRANDAILLLAADGTGIKVLNGSAGQVDFILDVNGYFQ